MENEYRKRIAEIVQQLDEAELKKIYTFTVVQCMKKKNKK